MDVHIGISTIISVAWPLSLVVMYFVAAAHGKRIGTQGDTIAESTRRSSDKAIARIENMFQTILDKKDK